MFEFLANLTNYKPKSFKGKTVKEILAMKSSNVGADFFDPANDAAIAEAGLMNEQLDAIEMLRDLKDKTKIYERCYKNKTVRRKIASPMKQAPKPAPIQEPEQPEEQEPEQQEPEQQEPEQQEPEQQMDGGGRRSRKHKRSGHKRSGHKRRGHKRSGHSKRSGHKHNSSCGHSKRSRRRKSYTGGADEGSYFTTGAPVIKPVSSNFSPPAYNPVIKA
jgi:hypothetical protein